MPWSWVETVSLLIATIGPLLYLWYYKRVKKREGWQKPIFITIGIVLFGSIFYLLVRSPTNWSANLAGILIAAGIPGLYYFHTEVVRQPHIIFTKDRRIKYQVAPLWWNKKINLGGKSIELPWCAKPAIFSRLTVKNIGEATATDCMIRVRAQVKDKDEPIDFDGRWARPNNPNRYNLLPGEKRDILLFRTPITENFYFVVFHEMLQNFLKKNDELFSEDKLDLPIVNNLEEEDVTFPEPLEDIKPKMEHPSPPRPEREDTTVGGGWIGKEIKVREGNDIKFKEVAVQAISEERKMNSKKLKNVKSMNEILSEIVPYRNNWQEQWFDIDSDSFISQVIETCK